jgi:hypothetical protein
LSLFLAAGCDLPGRPNEIDRPVPADQVKNFDTLYATRCANLVALLAHWRLGGEANGK